jgi:hypothetical protein
VTSTAGDTGDSQKKFRKIAMLRRHTMRGGRRRTDNRQEEEKDEIFCGFC